MERKLIIFLLAAVFVLTSRSPVNAQSATQVPADGVFLDWTTNTYAPSGFVGKRLPTSKSRVDAWFVLLKNGKVVDASLDTVRWYANNQLIQSGRGLQKITFNAPANTGLVVGIQARVQDQSGAIMVGSIQVPVVAPKVVIQNNYPGGVVASPSIDLNALSYFFNVSDISSLAFAWAANGQTAPGAENPDHILVNIGDSPSGTKINVGLSVSNAADSTSAKTNTTLVYQKL